MLFLAMFSFGWGEETSGIDSFLPEINTQGLTPDTSETVVPEEEIYQAGVSRLFVEAPQLSVCAKGQSDCFRLKVKLLDFVASGYSVPGDIVEAVVLEETHSDKNVLIPKGAKLVGVVDESVLDTSNKAAPKAVLSLKFDSLLSPTTSTPTPIPIQASWRRESHLLNLIGKGVTKGLMEGSVGAIKGALLGVGSGGLGMAVATQGSSLLTASGMGALMGIHKGLTNTSSAIVLNEGQVLSLSLSPTQSSQTLLLSAQPTIAPLKEAQNLNVLVQQAKLTADPFDVQNQLTVTFDVSNLTAHDLSAMNMAVVDAYGKRYFLSPFAANDAYKTVFKAKQKTHASLTFTIKNALEGYYLVVYNPLRPSEVMAKTGISL